MKNTSTFHTGQAVPLERDNIDTGDNADKPKHEKCEY